MVSRSALVLLADHLESRGLEPKAAELLLDAPLAGSAGAARLQEVVRLAKDRSPAERDALLEEAMALAAAEGAWGLAAQLLDLQIGFGSQRAVERRLRLSPRIDDAYGEWRLRREDPFSAERSQELERQLRSPRSAGGHAPGASAPAPSRLRSAPTRSPRLSMSTLAIGSLLHEGKAKRVHATNRPDVVAMQFKDDATAFNALKKAQLQGKGAMNCRISAILFEHLQQRGVSSHYLGVRDQHWMLARQRGHHSPGSGGAQHRCGLPLPADARSDRGLAWTHR